MQSMSQTSQNLCILVTVAGLLSVAGPAAAAFEVAPGERQLFCDDYDIAEINNLTRTMHPAAKKGAVIRPNWHLGATSVQVRTAPVWDPDRKVYKFWDCAATPPDLYAAGKACTGYYESTDGLHWSRPPLGQVQYDRWPENNYISLRKGNRPLRVDYIVYDPTDPDPSRRYKSALPPVGFAVSPDGKRWKMLTGIRSVPSGDEANFSLDEKAHLFLLTVKRGGPHGRAVHLETSKDFETWTNHGLMFHADKLDQELGRKHIKQRFADPTLKQPEYNVPAGYGVDVYNMGVFRYEGLYVGTPAMFHKTGRVSKDWLGFDEMQLSAEVMKTVRKHGDYTGFHHVQLACSRDLRTWRRLGDRQPFIDASRLGAGAYDLQGMIGPSNAVVRGDELWFYYTSTRNYAFISLGTAWEGCAISLAVLRRDGFISLDADEKEGTILTEPFKSAGDRLFVNVDALKGKLLVDVLGEDGNVLATSAPMKGDLARAEVKWQKGNIADLKSKAVSLRFTLCNASLYSYWLQ